MMLKETTRHSDYLLKKINTIDIILPFNYIIVVMLIEFTLRHKDIFIKELLNRISYNYSLEL